ncbi:MULTISPECIES: MarR family winged helix-turn-helix transcriptional regulator [Streptomyces]|uniref:MarR family winged helix-turn-helix transcriptional regulator n=1 Tax=Streptomyces TaxID=1883 RepID=UPI001CCB8C80|nr:MULTISPECIES: MarR family transcriptional regulator [Streptomyces]UBI37332.1 MarR family transcriptional regulator [Streptomyces mobaraensis]UKW29924.1 MarR family transcriptional regulator [Streptomyces sp. TYQ1024]
MTFFSDLVRCETRLYNALNEQLRRRHGIAASQFEFLRYLRDHPGARVGDLAAFFAIGVGATSKGMDRLEGRGWVRRIPHPADRRSSLLELTEAGVELVNDAEDAFATVSELVQAAVDPKQLQAMAQALRQLRAALEHDRIGTPVG